MSELKPCPFCGGEAWIDRDSSGWNKVKANHSDNCPLFGNNMLTWSSGSDVPMVGKWNTRALTPKKQCADEMYAFINKLAIGLANDFPSLRDSAIEILAKARGEL